jgi:cysteine-rich repeat protein
VRTGVEQCDLGAGNSNAPNAACRPDCRPGRCGDGIVDNARGEQCDDGNNAAGDGCAPGCFTEPPPTGDRIPGKGSSETDCTVEWAMDHPALDKLGVPSIKQSCKDGDASCDFGASSGECVFHVWVCANNHDPRLPFCTPGAAGVGSIISVEATKPTTRDAGLRAEDAANRLQLLSAAAGAQVSTFDTCGPRMDIRVPLKTPIRKGVKTLKLKGRTTRSLIDSDTLKLFCIP